MIHLIFNNQKIKLQLLKTVVIGKHMDCLNITSYKERLVGIAEPLFDCVIL